jgi:glycine betaine/proline transport system ATP-binding protein
MPPTGKAVVSKLAVEHVFKVFGRRQKEGVRRLEAGATREDLREGGTTAAVIDASFEVEPGEIFVVMGLSGSGKSTLLRMLNGLLEPTSGRVLFDGQDLTSLAPKALRDLRSRRISMVFQHFALFPHRSVLANAGYGLEVQGVPRAERERRATRALELVGLADWARSWPDELSGGMQQRVGLARALATDADVLLMDESFSALDPLIRRDMQDQLIELQHELRKTVVFITHDLNEAMRLGDRIAVMRDGRIVQTGTAQEILTAPADDYVAGFVQDVDRSRVLTAASIMKDPLVTVPATCDAEAARQAISTEEDAHAAFVVGPHGELVGAVTEEQVSADGDGGRGVRDLVDTGAQELVTTPADAPLAGLLADAARTTLPLAVVDEAGRLTGVISTGTLLAALGEDHGRPDAVAHAARDAERATSAGDAARTTSAVTAAPDDGAAGRKEAADA